MDIYGNIFEGFEIEGGVCEHSCYGGERAPLEQVKGIIDICKKYEFDILERWQVDDIISLLSFSPICPKDIQGLELLQKLQSGAYIEIDRHLLPEFDAEIRQVLCEYLINTYFKPNTMLYNPDSEGVNKVLLNLKKHYGIKDAKALYKKVYAKGIYKVLGEGGITVDKCNCIYDVITYIDKDLWLKGRNKAKAINYKYDAVRALLKG